jgi:hypothetical protein
MLRSECSIWKLRRLSTEVTQILQMLIHFTHILHIMHTLHSPLHLHSSHTHTYHTFFRSPTFLNTGISYTFFTISCIHFTSHCTHMTTYVTFFTNTTYHAHISHLCTYITVFLITFMLEADLSLRNLLVANESLNEDKYWIKIGGESQLISHSLMFDLIRFWIEQVE